MYHTFLVHCFIEGHTGCLHVLATVNSAAMNFGVHVTFPILVSSESMPSSGTVTTQRGGMGKEGGGGSRERGQVYPWLIHADAWQKPAPHC